MISSHPVVANNTTMANSSGSNNSPPPTTTKKSPNHRQAAFLARSMAHRTWAFVEHTLEQKNNTFSKSASSSSLSSLAAAAESTGEKVVISLERDELRLGRRIGQGTFSDVYELKDVVLQQGETNGVHNEVDEYARKMLGRRASSGRLAVKHLRLDILKTMVSSRQPQRYQRSVVQLVSEGQLLSRLDHPHIIKLHGMARPTAILDNRGGRHDAFFLVLDRIDCTLADRIQEWKNHQEQEESIGDSNFRNNNNNHKKNGLSHLDTKLRYARELASALEYLHSHRLIYRDLKPDNVGILNDSIVLFDFGLCRELPDNNEDSDEPVRYQVGELDETTVFQMSGVGTARYMAPEVMLKGKLDSIGKGGYNQKADIYSFSMVLYELLFHQKPYEMYTLEMLQLMVGMEHQRPVIPNGCPIHLRRILEDSWDRDPSYRPTFGELKRELIVGGGGGSPSSSSSTSRRTFVWEKCGTSSVLSERTCATTLLADEGGDDDDNDDSSIGSN